MPRCKNCTFEIEDYQNSHRIIHFHYHDWEEENCTDYYCDYCFLAVREKEIEKNKGILAEKQEDLKEIAIILREENKSLKEQLEKEERWNKERIKERDNEIESLEKKIESLERKNRILTIFSKNKEKELEEALKTNLLKESIEKLEKQFRIYREEQEEY